jgi:hypothetical protein
MPEVAATALARVPTLDSAGAAPAWLACELHSAERREQALAVTRELIPRTEFGAMAYDIEWRLGPEPDWSSVLAFVYRDEAGRTGYAPFFKQERPLELHLGEITYASFGIERFTLIGPPVLPEGSRNELTTVTLSLLDALASRLGPSGAIHFEGLPVESVAYELITSGGIATRYITVPLGEPFEHQFARLPDTYEEYLGELGSRSRQSVQYSERKLAKDMNGEVRVDCFETADAVERFLTDGGAVSRKTYQWNLLGLGLRDTLELRGRLRVAAQRGWLRSYVLYCRELPVAFMLGYQYAGCYYYTDVGYDPDYANWSVGSVLQLKVMQDLYARGNRPGVFDFSTGYGSHKARFGNISRREANVLLLPRRLKNRVIASAFLLNERASGTAVAALQRLGLKSRIKKWVRGIASSR